MQLTRFIYQRAKTTATATVTVTVAHLFDFRENWSRALARSRGVKTLKTVWKTLLPARWQLDALHLNLFKIQLLAKTTTHSTLNTHTQTKEV